jgi:hypothetical protein
LKRSCAFFLLLPVLAIAGTVTHTAAFDPSDLRLTKYQGFDLIEFEHGVTPTVPGLPALPEVPLTLVVPAGAEVKSVTAEPLEVVELPGAWNVLPLQPARPISRPGQVDFVPPDPRAYASDAAWPGRSAGDFHAGSAAGFRLVSVNLTPLQYHPQSGRLTLATRVRVTVEYADGTAPVLTPAQRNRARSTIVPLVANPADLDRFAPLAAPRDLPDVAYLIITADAFAADWQPFADYRSARGLAAEVKTREWIDRNCPGRDVQEKIRNLIVDYYLHRGLSYVLLAGDNPQVPCRKIRVSVFDETGDIPTDLYYGGLESSWDSNRNNVFGEMSDSIDLFADVLVGRASCDNQRQVQNFIRKVAIYENDPATDYIRRSLLPSGWLWRDISYHGKFLNDTIANITPNPWVDRKLENPRSAAIVADSFNHGFAIFDPAGHGNSGGVYDEDGTPIYLTANAAAQRNYRRYSIMTSLACDPGDFEAEDCCAEAAMNCDTAGCIGVAMNSRYGWGTPPSFGPSEKLCARYFDWFINHAEYVMGACHNRSREVYSASARYDALWRWCVTEFNLFGDPALDVWSDVPSALTVEAPASVPTGGQSLYVTVRAGGVPQDGIAVTAWKAGEVLATGTTAGGGNVTLPVHALTTGTLSVTAVRHNSLAGVAAVAVTQGAPEPRVVYRRHAIDDAAGYNPNGILEPGETGVLTLVVANPGLAAATNARVALVAITPGVALPDSTAPLGSISAGDSAATASLAIAAGPAVFPGSELQLQATVQSDQGTWEFVFGVEVGYPGRTTAEIDTGAVALTVTARGAIGFDPQSSPAGRGFRYPESDTSMLKTACFALSAGGRVIDQFYNQLTDGLDADWQLDDSVRSRAAAWSAGEMLTAASTDAGHPSPLGAYLSLAALGPVGPGVANSVILVYDLVNISGQDWTDAYAGILADFDVKATDRFHDLGRTLGHQHAAMMRSAIMNNRFGGVKLLTPVAPARATCIDHARYVYPDSGLSESMKHRALTGELGSAQSDRPYNWSVAVSTGPLDLAAGAAQRLAFAFVATEDSVAFEDACTAVQQWYDANVGVSDRPASPANAVPALTITPNPSRGSVLLRLATQRLDRAATLAVYDAAGRLVLQPRLLESSTTQTLAISLPAGVYLARLTTGIASITRRFTVVR